MSKQLAKKFLWMRGCIADSFGLKEDFVSDAIFGNEANRQKLELFLDSEGPPKILVYYQTPDTGSENDHNVIDPTLFITYGDTQRIKDKAVWFLRNLPENKKKININQTSNQQVLFGQVTPNSVRVLSYMIQYIYDPLISGQKHDWGLCDGQSKKEFMTYTQKFKKQVNEALKLMEPGQEHFKIKPEELQRLQGMSESERIQRFEQKFDEWIKTIERFLSTEPEPKNEGLEPGPKTELQFWKERMQTITNWSEQLKNKDFNMVKMALIKYKQNEGKKQGQENINKLMLSFQRLDLALTDKLNEAKDNVKYLSTLEKFIQPLYTGTPQQIIETLPSLMNAIKMIHTIARFYNTSDKMTGLFIKITNQMIKNCREKIIPPGTKIEDVWKRDPAEVIEVLGSCIKLNREYKEAYKATKEKVADMPKGKTFDFSETQIFNKFDQFVKRLQKLIEVFSNIQQFDALAKLNLQKMDVIIGKFNNIRDQFKAKRKNDLLDLTHSNFDKQYVSFNISISQLDTQLQQFIDNNFSKSKSIEQSINLLKKFENTIKRDALKHNLTSKYNTILTNYASQLEVIQRVFNDQKSDPPIVRNMPQNAGKIIWSKHLYQKIAGPITKFPQNVIHSSEIKKYYGNYNTLGKMLTINEMWYYDLWVKEIERSKAALQATLIVRHETQKKLYVNFDVDIMQLIREAKCLDRQGIPIPESARIILLQEEKFKMYYNELLYVLKEYQRIVGKIKPICKNLLSSHIADMELKLHPGMSTLTWTSMNIDSYLNHVHQGLNKLEQLIINVNDIIQNRIENNLKNISKVTLVSLPHENVTFTLETFVSKQQEYINEKKNYLTSKNLEVERSVDDLLLIIINYQLDPRIDPVKSEQVKRIKKYYFFYLYNALLNATQNSLNSMKHRVCGSNKLGSNAKLNPFFEVDVQLSGQQVQLNPSLEQIQKAINKAATAVLRCSKTLYNWDQHTTDDDKKQSLYQMIAQDKEIVKVILLLTGSIQGTKNKINQFISKFNKFEWLWKKSIGKSIKQFSKGSEKPQLSAYETEFKKFSSTEQEIEKIEPTFIIGAMQLKTQSLIVGLKQYTKQWKNEYAEDLHKKAKSQLYRLSDHISELIDKLSKTVVKDIDSLGIVMEKLEEIRSFQAIIDISFNPVTEMYALLDANLPGGITDKDQMDARIYLWSKWSTLIDLSEKIGKNLAVQQTQYLRRLKKDVKVLVKDIADFRTDYQKNGPMVEGIIPKEAIQRLKRFDEQYEVREHQFKINKKGQQLFGLQHQKYPALQKTRAELTNLKKLYNLYSEVIKQINSFQEMLWSDVNNEKIAAMQEAAKKYGDQCIKLPKDLKEWQAYKELKTSIQNLKALLPIITILKKEAVKDRHWQALNEKTTHRIPYDQPQMFVIEDLAKAKVLDLIEDIEQIGQSAEKQKKIQNSLGEINQYWSSKEFQFGPWGKRQNIVLGGLCVQQITERLEEDQMILSSINAQRHVLPFKKVVEEYIRRFSDTSEILDLWIKVQTLWRSLEPVFTGGDIAKQMPLQAKAFANIDKTWMRCMQKSFETKKVLSCCQLDLLKDNLPDMQKRLEECQKLLEAYLEGKRKLFPRFYFVSNPDLLKILSQGSEPTSIQQDFEKLFDAITRVEFGKSDKKGSSDKTITTIIQQSGGSEKVPLVTHVKCQGNIQSWLKSLQKEMQQTMREHCRNAAAAVMTQPLEAFVKSTLSQVSLMGIQLIWTHKITEALQKGQKQNKGALESKKKEIEKMLQELTNLCLQPIETSLERTKIQTLVTVHVHQRDIAVQMKCQNIFDFDWQKQTRLYWRSEQDTCMISITDWQQSYSYEFLGAKQRLCITPLTDRCYITLAQAMSMFYGGAPAGPAGTGKTETVKDLGRGLGIFVVVTNCSDQHRYKDMAKIFKGLVQSGLWGCFDEFNRIQLEVLSVVAMQVQAIGIAKKQKLSKFMFPEEPYPIDIVQSVGYFITMNPGYAGRQELPENLKVLFRGVTMMMPDRQIIIKVKLASVGYEFINGLSKKFNMLYKLCEEQLSKQRHYDFGLRNILSVLRTAGNTKRKQTKSDMVFTPEKKQFFEEFLLMRSLRDMNMSKLVFDDIPLFEGLLRDIFPRQTSADKVNHAHVEGKIPTIIKKRPQLINRPQFSLKIIQVYETSEVRHGFMLLGLSITGKTTILSLLTEVLSEVPGRLTYRIIKMNPKAITDKQMYGVKSEISDDWIPGVFSTLWQKCNSRSSKFNIWLTCDGPVDAIWIENLNTVLDDNKILTLANGERIPMTDQCKLVFEVENLNNASPATVSRCGQIYISPNDLGTTALYEGWCQLRALQRSQDEANILKRLLKKYFQDLKIVQTLEKNIKNPPMMDVSLPMKMTNTMSLVNGILKNIPVGTKLTDVEYQRVVVFSLSWAIGGLYEAAERYQFHEYLQSKNCPLPANKKQNETIFDYYLLTQDQKIEYSVVKPETWKPSPDKAFKFAQLLLPTLDSFRVQFLTNSILTQPKPSHSNTAFVQNGILLIGGSGTAKTSSVLMWAGKFDPTVQLFKRINFSSATSPGLFQASIEQECDNKMGKEYGPPQNKLLAIFVDDLSMPFVNKWGDQVTLQIVRQLIEQGGFYWLDKAQRGNFKSIKNLSYVGAMNHPGGGRNDIPNRLKRQFFIFNMILPLSIEGIYGPIVRFQFRLDTKNHGFTDEVKKVIENLTGATIKLWQFVKKFMLPTPSKFHYMFNMRQLSRTFKGILQIKKQSIMKTDRVKDFKPQLYAVGLWRYECERVFCDKLVNNKDKDTVLNAINDISIQSFGMEAEINDKFARQKFFAFADFLTADQKDEEGVIVQFGPRNYQAISQIQALKKRAYECMQDFNFEPKNTKKLELVLFIDALKHLLKVIRIIRQPRSSALLVGVGGSGKQSLTRLSAFIQRMDYKQIELVKNYSEKDLKQDIKKYFEITGRFGKNCCFILTDSEIKKEQFLQFINMILSTGQIPGLLAKDEKETFLGDARNDYVKEFKGVDPAPSELYAYFVDRIRDNLHVCLCFSPVGQKFRDRFRKFPALFNECTIDWFLPWPQEALISVAESFIEKFKQLDTQKQTKANLMKHMGNVHLMVTQTCDVYFARMRRQVYFTPKSYLSYLQAYKKLYMIKYNQLDMQESNFKIGVNKINEASLSIAEMKKILSQEEIKLKDASEKTEKMLKDLEVEQKAAQKIEAEVNVVAQKCQKEAEAIARQKEQAEKQLAAAIPAQMRAQAAVDSLDAASVNEMKANKKPQQILKLVLDAIAIYFNLKLASIQMIPDLQVAKGINISFWRNSFEESGKFILFGNQFDFLKNLKGYDKDAISNETIELLEPLLLTGVEWFNENTCGKVSKAIAAICKWLYAVYQYHEKSQIVKPKKIKLAQEQANLQIARQKLAKAREQLRVITQKLNKLKEDSQKQLDIKNQLEFQAQKTKKKITTAETLINSLSGERARWKKGASQISDEKKRLVGNCSLATAFISYCGPFNADFREILAIEKFTGDMKLKEIPNLPTLAYELTSFLVDQATVGQWNLQGLPKDTLSVQNGIMVTRSDRYPLLIDPQGQGQAWILRKYADEMEKGRSICTLTHPKFKDWFLKFCLENGKTLLVEGIQNQVDPILDPVLQKQIIWKKSRGSIKIAGGDMDFDKNFKMFMTCRLPNPSFSPQLSAKTTIIDFTVTQGGLEQQLLGKVISHEQKSLQDSLNALLNDVNANKKALQKLDKDLLQRLTQSTGNLLDDTSLMEVLNNTKTQAKEVAIKLDDAQNKTKQINEKRQQYRPVAIRGSALYFTLIELFLVNWMYNSSLEQFLELFNWALAQKSPQANSPQKRVDFIIKAMTKYVHKYVNRGLFEKDKITFMLMICFKILITAKKLTGTDVGAFLKAGAGQDIKTARPRPQGNQFNFLDQKSWLNIIAFSKHTFGESSVPNFKELPDLIQKNQPGWLQYFDKNDPENYPIPDLAQRMSQQKQQMRAFMQMTLVRCVRQDRTLVAGAKFISAILGQQYVEPISYPMQDIWAQSKFNVPILFLLSPGADPTSAIDDFARKKKKVTEKVSMGQGQQQPARRAIKACMQTGGWVILQNCQLGLKFMEETQQLIITLSSPDAQKPHQDFRLWITCQPHNRFPLGLLQKVLKVTNEPPKGLKAGLYKTFTTMINQQFLEKVDNPNWKNLIFTVCYLHSVVIQRRKFGSLGWCVPYQYNNSDLEASLCFIEKYLNNLVSTTPQQSQIQQINTTVLKYMVCQVLYGGRITDDLDRQLFATFGQEYIKDGMLNVNEYVFFGNDSKDKNAFKYKMPANPGLQLAKYHEYISTIPSVDSPEVFGLDSNADLTFRMKESIQMIFTIMETRPKEASVGGGKTREQIVKQKALDFLSKMPLDYNQNQVRQLIKKLSGPKALGSVGYSVPCNIFLSQEISRMQVIFNIVRKTLIDACDAIDGQIIMTAEIMDSINAIFDARVPNQWVYDATGAQISWIIPTLAKWFNDMIERNKQLYEWMKGNRPYTFWLGGFFNPQGFLTAMKQQVTRMHKTGKPIGGGQIEPPWSLDDVVYQSTVKEKDQDLIRQGRDKDVEGVYIRQLILEGCRWHKNSLQAARPKEMFAMLPLLHVTAINKKKSGDDKSVYNCPVYKYAKRTDRYLIFRVNLNSESEAPSKWKLKGVALLCARD